MGQRINVGRIRETQGSGLLCRLSRLDHLFDDLLVAGIGIGHDGRSERPWERRQHTPQQGLGIGAQQRAQLCGAVQIEQHEFAAVSRQVRVQGRDDRAGGHREIHHGLECQDRRKLIQPPVAPVAGDALLQRHGQLVRLPGRIDRERIVLERIEFGQHAQPGGLCKRRQQSRQAGQSGEAGKAGQADHRRNQDHAIGARKRRVFVQCIQHIFQREGAAVGKSDQMQRCRRAGAPFRFPHGQSRGREPLLPAHLGQRAGNGSVCRQADRDHGPATIAITPGDMTKAVRRVGQAVQQNHGADGWSVRLQRIRTVPVLRVSTRIHRAAVEIAVDRQPVLLIQPLRDVAVQALEDRRFGVEVACPIGPIEPFGAQFIGDVTMPRLERGAALCIVGPHCQQRQRHHAKTHQAVLDALNHDPFHPRDSWFMPVTGAPIADSPTIPSSAVWPHGRLSRPTKPGSVPAAQPPRRASGGTGGRTTAIASARAGSA